MDLGQKIKDHLLSTGLIEAEFVPIGRSRKLVLRNTTMFKKSGRASNHSVESIPHAYWKNVLAKTLMSEGFEVRVETPRRLSGGRADLIAERDKRKFAIEIETGSSCVLSNIKKNLSGEFDHVFVVGVDKRSLSAIEQRAGALGLFLPTRLTICLPSDFLLELRRETWGLNSSKAMK